MESPSINDVYILPINAMQFHGAVGLPGLPLANISVLLVS